MKKFTPRVRRGVVALTGVLGVAVAMPVVADDAGLEEIVVTARKREENLQNVSMSITAISAAEIEKLGAAPLKPWLDKVEKVCDL